MLQHDSLKQSFFPHSIIVLPCQKSGDGISVGMCRCILNPLFCSDYSSVFTSVLNCIHYCSIIIILVMQQSFILCNQSFLNYSWPFAFMCPFQDLLVNFHNTKPVGLLNRVSYIESVDQCAEKGYLYNLISDHDMSFYLFRSLIFLNGMFSFLCRALAHLLLYRFLGI